MRIRGPSTRKIRAVDKDIQGEQGMMSSFLSTHAAFFFVLIFSPLSIDLLFLAAFFFLFHFILLLRVKLFIESEENNTCDNKELRRVKK